jgi:hypothetical protein
MQTKLKTWISVVTIATLTIIFVYRTLDYIGAKSPIYDEAYHISRGLPTLKTGDYRLRGYNTFLVSYIAAVPLLFTGVSFSTDNKSWQAAKTTGHTWDFGLDFLYRNTLPYQRIVFLSRLSILFVSLLGLACIFYFTNEFYGGLAALFAVFFYTFSPNILAHSGIVTEDLPITVFIFASVCCFYKYLSSPGASWALLCGLLTGLANNTKHTALFLFPIFVLLFLISKKKPVLNKTFFVQALLFLAGFSLVFLAVYRVTNINEYFQSIAANKIYLSRGQMSFLAGRYSQTGFWNFFLVAFLIKTTVPILILMALGIFLKKFTQKEYFLLIPAAVLFLLSSLSHFHIGHRHILPVYPFVFVFAAGVASDLMRKRRFIPAACLGAYFAVTSIASRPNYLSYFNELIGGSKNGYKYLVDSSLDWGQDLKGLEAYVSDNKVSDVVLSYYGACTPESISFNFQDLFSFSVWGKKDHLNSGDPSKEILAISATNLQGLYLGKIGTDVFYWLKDKKTEQVIGDTIFVYDITRDVEAHERLAHIYFYTGQYDKSLREINRALALDDKRLLPKLLLSFIYSVSGKQQLSTDYLREIVSRDPSFSFFDSSLISNSVQKKIYLSAFGLAGQVCEANKFKRGSESIEKFISGTGNF